MNKLLLLALLILPLGALCQGLTPKLAVTQKGDTVFQFTPYQARIIVRKLVRGESAKVQLLALRDQLDILGRRAGVQDSTIRIKSAQIHLLRTQVMDAHHLTTRQNILLLAQQDRVKQLEKDLRRQRWKTSLAGTLGIASVILALLVH